MRKKESGMVMGWVGGGKVESFFILFPESSFLLWQTKYPYLTFHSSRTFFWLCSLPLLLYLPLTLASYRQEEGSLSVTLRHKVLSPPLLLKPLLPCGNPITFLLSSSVSPYIWKIRSHSAPRLSWLVRYGTRLWTHICNLYQDGSVKSAPLSLTKAPSNRSKLSTLGALRAIIYHVR